MRLGHRGRKADRSTSIHAESPPSMDDPKVVSALEAYLAELEAGRRPSRDELLEGNPEIAEALAGCLGILELVHSAAEAAFSSGPLPQLKDALPPDTILGEYRLVREIGRGGMGIVYEAEQASLGRHVALKVLSGTAALDSLKLQRFRVETQAVAQLHHPHIVPIFAVGSERGAHYYAMQYIDGPTLAEVIHQQRRFGWFAVGEPEGGPISSVTGGMPATRSSAPSKASADEASGGGSEVLPSLLPAAGTSSTRGRGAFLAVARLAIQAAEALDHAHAMGVLHRDIKPSNLLIDSRANLWVTDFGLARFQDEPGLTRTGDLLGTLRYMAPELMLGHRIAYDPRSDVYSLGATFYELITLRPVFDGRDRHVLLRQIAQDEPIPPRRLDPAIPRDLETIILKAMDKEPDRRYATAREMAEDLGRYLEDKTIRARPPTPAELAVKWARRHRAVLRATATVAVLALAIAAPLLWWEQRNTTRMYHDQRDAFEQAEQGFKGFEQMVRLSDELTIKGMNRYAQPGQSPEAQRIRMEFFQQAVEFYDRLASEPHTAKPMRALAYRRLGFARMMGLQDMRAEGDFRRSLALYEELLAESPREPALRDVIGEVQMNLGLALLFSGRLDAANASFRRATAMGEGLASDFPDDPGQLQQLTGRRLQIASWMETAGRRTEAERERRQLLSFYEGLAAGAAGSSGRARIVAASYYQLAQMLGTLGQYRERQEALRKGLKLEPEDPALLNGLAWALTLRPDATPGEWAEAGELAKRAVAANPKEPAFWNTLGLAQLRAGHWSPAAEALGKSIELQSQGGDAVARLLMAMVCSRRGDKPAALDWYMRSVDGLLRNPEPKADLGALRAEAESVLGRSPTAEPRPKR
jgi:serine/threonine protein kinase/Tfp pilus assembly protein PilF